MAEAEDQRAAANLTVTLSSFLITAALAVMGAQGVIVTIVLDRRHPEELFYVVTIAGSAAMIVSAWLGGLGIWDIIKSGHAGVWKIVTKHGYFDLQAICLLAGTVAVLGSPFLTHAATVAAR